MGQQILTDGSSPLTRGKHVETMRDMLHRRLIPAHAGKTQRVEIHRLFSGAHPRSRGENAVSDPHSRTAYGSSPLTRGKP